MRANIHPNYNPVAEVTCSCGNQFTIGSTRDKIYVELCNKCHPFYTGTQKFVDTASRIEKFQKRVTAYTPRVKKHEERKEDNRPQTLREMLESLKKQ